jgi:multiple sugar transport system substrate-binding protein
MKILRYLLVIIFLFSASCSRLPFFRSPEPTGTLPVSSPTPAPAVTRTPEDPFFPDGPITLKVWIPPEFDPFSGTPAGDLLQARLNEFASRRPMVRMDIRVKTVDGAGGLLESLSTTSAAAPLAMPDLVALPRPVMEAAALKGLIQPLNGLTYTMDDSDWYDFARNLSQIQSTPFGIPFAGDALCLIYRPDIVEKPLLVWSLSDNDEAEDEMEGVEDQIPVFFPASDPQALVTLALYQSVGGRTQDAQGRPTLDAVTLAKVLQAYQEANLLGFLPQEVVLFENDDQVWEAYTSGQADMVISWFSRYVQDRTQGYSGSAMPSIDGTPYTLATGWVWTLANNQPEKLDLAVQLAEFLTDPLFLAEWTHAAGYLPARGNALAEWPSGSLQSLAGQIAISAHLAPSADILSSIAPPLQQAAVQILNQLGEPILLAEEAADRLNNP